METKMLIREYNWSDQHDVIGLWYKCELVNDLELPALTINRKFQHGDRGMFLVGTIDDRVVATVMGGYDGHRGHINRLAVHPDHNRNGYGAEMIRSLETKLKERGCQRINLQVQLKNKDVIAFYQTLAYNIDEVVGLGKEI